MKCSAGTCFTCRIAGLADCMDRGARLPLVEGRVGVATRLYPTQLTEAERDRIWQFLRDRGVLE